MKYIILSRNDSLQYIQGRHMIEYAIESIPSNDIFIIYNIFLDEYNFQEILINKCKSKNIYFAQIDYQTRGAVETAFVGMNKLIELKHINNDNDISNDNDNVVFIDSDKLHNITKHLPIFESEFIGYTDNSKPDTSFNELENNKITDFYCCGFYGFKNINNFLKYALMLLKSENTNQSFCFTNLYNLVIKNGVKVESLLIEDTKHISIDNNKITKEKLRICFDLDNTLVSYPTVVGDYSTVKPINRNIMLLKKLKSDGHEIIIYTARRMKTHNGNVGKVIKDIARITIDTLEKLNIDYDELIFGKPIADIYIDDRAINPYINDISYFGLSYDIAATKFIPNKIKNNK